MKALLEELHSKGEILAGKKLASVYFGGGTPSLMEPGMIARLLDALGSYITIAEDTEISMEMNPGTLDESRAGSFLQAGINRVSLGMQSAVDRELKALGRIHDGEDILRSYDLLKKAGFDNISLDIMYGIPYQTAASLKTTLDTAISLDPSHISAYSLILEEGTPFGDADPSSLALPSEDEACDMHLFTIDHLKKAGYERYEISNYAKRGKECRHNIRYWERKDYLGLGISAASLVDEVRWTNGSDMGAYLKDPCHSEEMRQELCPEERMEEYMFLGLRMIRGVSLKEFEKEFGRSLFDIYGSIPGEHMEKGLSCREGDRYMLTAKGLDISNIVLADYMLCKV